MVTTKDRSGATQTTTRRVVAAVFDSEDRTIQALNELKADGFTADHVSVVAKDKRQMSNVAERADMVTGGALGGLAGFLVGISALVIPGIGPIVGTGILVSTLAGAGIGALTGGLVGALVEQGVPEEDARGYERHVSEGRILVTVGAESDERARAAHDLLHARGGADVRGYGYAS